MRKFYEEVVLLKQAFVINPDMTVEQALKDAEKDDRRAGQDHRLRALRARRRHREGRRPTSPRKSRRPSRSRAAMSYASGAA